MDVVYEISRWSEVFETSESRRLKSLNWVAFPIRTNSSGYQSLIDEFGDQAASLYGAWCALVLFAAQQTTRGRLGNAQGKPVSLSTIARTTGFPKELFERLFEWAKRDDIGWLVPSKTQENADKIARPANTQQPPSNGPAMAQQIHCLPDQTGPDTTRHDTTQQDITKPDTQSGSGLGDCCFDSKSVFEQLTPSDLQKPMQLKAWFEYATKLPNPVVQGSEENLINVFGAAERAMEKGDNPVAVFASIVGKGLWNFITPEQERRGAEKLKSLHPKRTSKSPWDNRIAGMY